MIETWHLAVLASCCLGTTAVVAGVVLLFMRRKR